MSLAELSLRRPVTAVMFYVSLIVIGIIAAFRLPLEILPEINPPFVLVQLPYPGSTPEEVERTITRPAEEALATMSGIKQMDSTSGPDGANIFLQFNDWSRNIAITASEAHDRIDAIRNDLPKDLQRFQVLKFSPSDQAILSIRFATNRDMRGEYQMIQNLVQKRLQRVDGVAKVEITGVFPPEVEIAIDPQRLTAHGLSLNELATRLQAANFSVSAGEIDDGQQRIRVQPVGEVNNLDGLRNLVLNAQGLRLGEVAVIHQQPQKADIGRRLDGRTAVGVNVFRERSANMVNVAHAVLEEMNRIAAQEPEFRGVQIKLVQNAAEGVTGSINELTEAGLIGSGLSLLILFYFLRHWPSTLMVSLAIPICIVITLGAMSFLGMSLNILSMMGLLLGVGMLVDNAVVVVESIYQYREKWPDDPVRCAIEGTRSVQTAISVGTLASIIVFAPNLLGARNQITIFLGEVAVTITIALLASWLVAVSLIPMISARLKTPPAVLSPRGFIPRLSRGYAKALRWTLAHRGWSIAGIATIVLISLTVPTKFMTFDMNKNDVGRQINMYYNFKGAYSLNQISDEVLRVEQFLDARRQRYQIKQIYSFFSTEQGAGTYVTLRDPNPSLWDRMLLRKSEPGLLKSEDVQEMIRKELPKSARAIIGFQGDGGGGPGGGDQGVKLYINGDSSAVLREIGDDLVKQISKDPKASKILRDVRVDTGDETSEVEASVNRDRAAAYGFSAEEVASYIGIALRGAPLHEFRTPGGDVPVWVRFAGADKFRMEDLSNLTLRRKDGSAIPLLSVVDVSVRKGASQIQRTNRQTTIAVVANLAPKATMDQARKELERVMSSDSFHLPGGYRTNLGGGFQNDDDTGSQMLRNMVIALFMVYLVMAALFESLLLPSAIISSILFSTLGVFWLFAITGTNFSIMAMIGMLVLMGVVVNNGIVLFAHINSLRRNGVERTEALVEGARERLRPILMTMATAIVGMLPMCMGTTQIGGDGPAYYPMARAVAGGLAFSTVVSLLFLPTIYATLDDLRAWTVATIRRARDRAPMRRAPEPVFE
jgi:HAE1 family hydrophobic/amphiphilic exporter-1